MAGGLLRPRTCHPASASGQRGSWPRSRQAATGPLACSWPNSRSCPRARASTHCNSACSRCSPS
eukprot:3166869-Alexandrium_andersonii.AAC.1